jgi:hypothetical protein
MKIRIAKYRSHLYFNHRCKESKVLPFSLRFKPPIRSRKGFKLMENTGFSFLRLRVNDCHQSIQRLRSDCQCLLGELSDLIDCSEVLWIEEFCRSQFRKESIKQREKHDKKCCVWLERNHLINRVRILRRDWLKTSHLKS